MEQQRIGSINPSVHAAGIDPAFVPGLTPPRPEDASEDAAEPAEAPEEQAASADAPAPEDAVPAEAAALEDTAESADSEDAAEAADPEEDEPGEPDFEVSDRRASIVTDRVGVRFTLDEEEADFRWDEIGAVEIDTPRFGRRFTVTVYTTERRWYECQVEAPSRAKLKEWATQLDAVLDTHFEDPEASPTRPGGPSGHGRSRSGHGRGRSGRCGRTRCGRSRVGEGGAEVRGCLGGGGREEVASPPGGGAHPAQGCLA